MENKTENNKIENENKPRRNFIYWGTQATVDYAVKMSDEQITQFCQLIELEKQNLDEKSEIYNLRNQINKPGHGDIELKTIPSEYLKIVKDIVRKIVPETEWDKRPGGSPFYSTQSGAQIGNLIKHGFEFATVKYNGILVSSLEELIEEKGINKELVSCAQKRPEKPGTVSLETSKYKIMAPNSEGRSLKDLDFDNYINNLTKVSQENPESKILVCLGGLNKGKPEEYKSLIEKVRNIGDNIKIFIGTNAFGEKENETINERNKRINEVYELLKLADIVSMNDTETQDIYNAVHGHRDLPLAEKLLGIDLKGIRISHSAEGVLFYCNVLPETLFDESITKNFSKNIQNFLQLSVDGTSYAYQEGIIPNFTQIKLFSENIRKRQNAPFNVRFLVNKGLSITNEYVPNGLVYAIAPEVKTAKGGVTGLGAVFDGLLAAFFMSIIKKNNPLNQGD